MEQFVTHKKLNVPFASASTFNSAIETAGARKVAFEVPATALTYNFYCNVAHGSSDTYRRLSVQGVYSDGSGIYNWEVPENTGNMMVTIPCDGFNYMKLEASGPSINSGVTNGLDCNVHLMF